jgi:hypothetical protein
MGGKTSAMDRADPPPFIGWVSDRISQLANKTAEAVVVVVQVKQAIYGDKYVQILTAIRHSEHNARTMTGIMTEKVQGQ